VLQLLIKIKGKAFFLNVESLPMFILKLSFNLSFQLGFMFF